MKLRLEKSKNVERSIHMGDWCIGIKKGFISLKLLINPLVFIPMMVPGPGIEPGTHGFSGITSIASQPHQLR